MTNDELISAIRVAVREDVNTIVTASEERIGTHLDAMDSRLDAIDSRFDAMDSRLTKIEYVQAEMVREVDRLGSNVSILKATINLVQFDIRQLQSGIDRIDTNVKNLQTDVNDLKVDVKQLKTDMKGVKSEQEEIKAVLDLSTIEINKLQASQRTVEIKVDESIGIMKLQIGKFGDYVEVTSKQFMNMVAKLDARLTHHETLARHQNPPTLQ